MLVLGRRVGEVVTIGENIRVRVTDVRGDMIYIGVEAPREIEVHRLEVYNAIKRTGGVSKWDGQHAELGQQHQATMKPRTLTASASDSTSGQSEAI